MYGIFMKAGSFIKTGTIKKVSPNYFTGKASLQIISGTPKPKEADVLHVKFHKGARTKIHAHTSGQMLIVTGGTGSLITYSGNSKKIPFKVKIKEKIPLRNGFNCDTVLQKLDRTCTQYVWDTSHNNILEQTRAGIQLGADYLAETQW